MFGTRDITQVISHAEVNLWNCIIEHWIYKDSLRRVCQKEGQKSIFSNSSFRSSQLKYTKFTCWWQRKRNGSSSLKRYWRVQAKATDISWYNKLWADNWSSNKHYQSTSCHALSYVYIVNEEASFLTGRWLNWQWVWSKRWCQLIKCFCRQQTLKFSTKKSAHVILASKQAT